MLDDNLVDMLQQLALGHRGVCAAVWGRNDIAYRCKTCAKDPTCAICVQCFRDSCHKDHEYLVVNTSDGCCDCGDSTARAHDGFLSHPRRRRTCGRCDETVYQELIEYERMILLLLKCKGFCLNFWPEVGRNPAVAGGRQRRCGGGSAAIGGWRRWLGGGSVACGGGLDRWPWAWPDGLGLGLGRMAFSQIFAI
ncbi:hypothetical protein R6Q59_003365 [Mikania micrantha]